VLEVGGFSVMGRRVWVGTVVSDDAERPIQAISFSFDRSSLMMGIERNVRMLRARGVRLSLEPSDHRRHVRLVMDVMTGKIPNAVAFRSLSMDGLTPFERRVYEHLTKRVKRGSVITYGELARELGTSARAIGGAMKRNPYPVVVPCHRVVSKEGIGGYTPSRDHKLFLLRLENHLEG